MNLIRHIVTTSAAAGVLACFGAASFAGFQINAVKTDDGTKDIVELYFFNDGLNNTGTALEAYEVNYTGVPIQFRWIEGTGGDPGYVDHYNHGSDPAYSWFRVHPSRHMPFYASPGVESTAWRSPITNFNVTWATFELTPLPANVGLGARYARLIVPDGASFNTSGKVGGEIGGSTLLNFNYAHFIANLPPAFQGDGSVTVGGGESDGGNVGGSGGGPDGAPLASHRVKAIDADGQLLSFTMSDVNNAAAAGFSFSQVALDTYDILWDPNTVLPGAYRFDFVAQDSSVQSNSISTTSLLIHVVPEPASAAALFIGAASLGTRRRMRH